MLNLAFPVIGSGRAHRAISLPFQWLNINHLILKNNFFGILAEITSMSAGAGCPANIFFKLNKKIALQMQMIMIIIAMRSGKA
ncbi:hypothetical protein [Dickeya oryzae]